jgi:hypothetical protein
MLSIMQDITEANANLMRYCVALTRATNRELTEFNESYLMAAQVAMQAFRSNPMSLEETMEVLVHKAKLMDKGMSATNNKLRDAVMDQMGEGMQAFLNTVMKQDGEKISGYLKREAEIMEAVADFHEEIEKIKDEFGFQFNTPNYELVHETSTFKMYQVLPIKEGVKVRDDLKPMLLVPPYMLGAHILAFLPYEDKSYAHAFANEGIPTYIRITKDIMTTEAVQTTTPERDCEETAELCAKIAEKHGQKMTLNGTCQGGYIALINVLSGRLQESCDTLITNVAPIDGTHSESVAGMPQLPHEFVTETLPNGNKVANGYLLSLGMRFVAIDRETPLIKVLDQASLHKATNLNPGKTSAALFRWLLKERVHLPFGIHSMSSLTFQEPVADNGDLPIKMFGETLNVKKLAEMKMRWYQDYALKDDLVTPKCATGANRHLDGTDVIESVPFPAGHVAVLTSPYNKRAPVNGEFQTKDGKTYRGPVKFQLDISAKPKAPRSGGTRKGKVQNALKS